MELASCGSPLAKADMRAQRQLGFKFIQVIDCVREKIKMIHTYPPNKIIDQQVSYHSI